MPTNLDQILSENTGLSETQQVQINEAWEQKLVEARNKIRDELREEYAQKYTHDKRKMAEAMDAFLSDKISVELKEYVDDRKKFVEARVEYKQKIDEHTKMLDQFMTQGLTEEVKELRADKIVMAESLQKLENFILKQLAEELHEFHAEKKALVEQKVKMVRDGKKHLQEVKADFIKRAATLIEANTDKVLKDVLTQFRTEIKESRENVFGRKMFEAFVGEFMTSHLNEGTEVRKLQNILSQRESELTAVRESTESLKSERVALETKLTESQHALRRNKVMTGLMSSLDRSKQRVMSDLLESVRTDNLEAAFTKYLPTVLNESSTARTQATSNRTNITESTVPTTRNGSRVSSVSSTESDDELGAIIKLAGIKK